MYHGQRQIVLSFVGGWVWVWVGVGGLDMVMCGKRYHKSSSCWDDVYLVDMAENVELVGAVELVPLEEQTHDTQVADPLNRVVGKLVVDRH
jgi:hypothetical protein